jgi:alkylhydroperoxidase family enzyme
MSQEDIKSLRQHGYTDEDIHDITQIVAYFNYLNRIADALGIPPEEELMDPWPREDGQWDIV